MRQLPVLQDASVPAPDAEEQGDDVLRPEVREQCFKGGARHVRPCPYVSCHHHLWPVAGAPTGIDPLSMEHTCVLDVIDEAELVGEPLSDRRIAEVLNMDHEAVIELLSEVLSRDEIREALSVFHDEDTRPEAAFVAAVVACARRTSIEHAAETFACPVTMVRLFIERENDLIRAAVGDPDDWGEAISDVLSNLEEEREERARDPDEALEIVERFEAKWQAEKAAKERAERAAARANKPKRPSRKRNRSKRTSPAAPAPTQDISQEQ